MVAKRLILLLVGLAAIVPATATLAGDSDPADIQNLPQTDFVMEDFELGWLPEGWATFQLGYFPWTRSSFMAHSGSYSARARPGPAGSQEDSWLVLPGIDFTSLIDPKLEWYEDQFDWEADGDHHYIMYSTTSQTDPAAFTPLLTMTPASHDINGFSGDPMIISLVDLIGNPVVYLAFRYVGEAADDWFIDDVAVYDRLPHDVMATAVTPNGQQYDGGNSFTPQGTFRNVGMNTESFDVSMEIYEDGTLVYTQYGSISSLAPGASQTVPFPSFTVADGHLYTLTAVCSLVGDDQPANDRFSGYNNTYTLQHVPMGMFFTNAGCGPCAYANPILDSYIASHGDDVALIRVHVWWPGSDAIYNANTAQAQELVALYDVGAVPWLFIDNVVEPGSSYGSYVSQFNTRLLRGSPNLIHLGWDNTLDELRVTIQNIQPLPEDQDLYLKVAITEDNIYYNGGNGEPWLHQAMRRFYPDTAGMPVSAAPGIHQYIVSCPIQGGWVYGELRGTVYVEDQDTWEVIQAATRFLNTIEFTPTGTGTQVALPYRLDGNFPNPFNPRTSISFSLPGQELVELTVFALDGSRVRTLVREVLPAGSHQVDWDGRNDQGGQVASGTYLCHLKVGDFTQSRTMTLLK